MDIKNIIIEIEKKAQELAEQEIQKAQKFAEQHVMDVRKHAEIQIAEANEAEAEAKDYSAKLEVMLTNEKQKNDELISNIQTLERELAKMFDKVKRFEKEIKKEKETNIILTEKLAQTETKTRETEETYKKEILILKDKYSKALEELKCRMEDEKSMLTKKLTDKMSHRLAGMTAEIDYLRRRIAEEHDERVNYVVRLNTHISAYALHTHNTLTYIRECVEQAYSGTNQRLQLMLKRDIIENRIFSLSYFDEKLQLLFRDALGQDNQRVAIDEVRNAFEECLNEEEPTWIDVLSRLYCYTQTTFLADDLVSQGLNVYKIAAAFQTTQIILKQHGFHIVCPRLYQEAYAPDVCELWTGTLPISNCLPELLAKIRVGNMENKQLIVDLWMVGFYKYGQLKKKSVVVI